MAQKSHRRLFHSTDIGVVQWQNHNAVLGCDGGSIPPTYVIPSIFNRNDDQPLVFTDWSDDESRGTYTSQTGY